MATPSSSTTTPSPQLRHQPATAVTPAANTSNTSTNMNDKEDRDRAVEKFLARAEIAKLTRGLRARLSYASYKAIHNVAHTTLPDLEAQSQAQAQNQGASTRNATGRAAAGNYYNNPATQGNSAMTPGGSASTRAAPRKGSMAPPPLVTASATQSLFASILTPPPAKRARTIHNPQDPPVPPPTKMSSAPPVHKVSKTPRATEGSQAKSKPRKMVKDKGKGRQHADGKAAKAAPPEPPEDMRAEVDVDMQVAATLTSLMLSRQSMSASASSPRSSLSGGSDVGSAQFAHYAQSSARNYAAAAPGRQGTPAPDGRQRQDSAQDGGARGEGQMTPKPQHHAVSRLGTSSTPHAPSDTEAADLMLFLATSPSPVRPMNSRDRDTQDPTVRALGGGLKGRALFPAVETRLSRRDETGSLASIASTVTAVNEYAGDGSTMSVDAKDSKTSFPTPSKLRAVQSADIIDVPMEPTIIPATPTEPSHSPRLLPAPPSPGHGDRSHTVQGAANTDRTSSAVLRPTLSLPEGRKVGTSPAPFHLSDFVNMSPSPAAGVGPPSRLDPKVSADMGRRLFGEPQGPHVLNGNGPRTDSPGGRKSGLGAGIDLVKSGS